MTCQALILVLALLLDRMVGDPPWLWARLPHPVVLFGNAIGFCDRRFNRPHWPDRRWRAAGIVAILSLLALSAAIGWLLSEVFDELGPLGFLLEIAVVAIFLAQKSLGDHVAAVAKGLREGGLDGGRRAVSMIVGRDPQSLDGAGVSRAAIESLAENFSDGVVAPALWYAVAGLPGILAYKMLNTADSMIGHKSEKYLHFGWASARLDDVANWPAARLSALLIAVAAGLTLGRWAGRSSFDAALTDSGLHRSPNSGWPESAMAGAIDVRLAGPRRYGGVLVRETMINSRGKPEAGVEDIERAVALFYAGGMALTFLAGAWALLLVIL